MAANVMSYSHIRITAIYLPRHGNSIVPHPPLLPPLQRERERAGVKRFKVLDQNLPRIAFKYRHFNALRTTFICERLYLYLGVN